MTATFDIQGHEVYAMSVSRLRDADFAQCRTCDTQIDERDLGMAILTHRAAWHHPKIRLWRFV